MLCDDKYNSYFSKLNRDQIKSANFYEDLPNLEPRNAFKIDKKGDKNNICFETLHFKIMCKYNISYFRDSNKDMSFKPSYKQIQTKNSKLTNKQLRKKHLLEAKEKRYYSKINKTDQLNEIKTKFEVKT